MKLLSICSSTLAALSLCFSSISSATKLSYENSIEKCYKNIVNQTEHEVISRCLDTVINAVDKELQIWIN